MVLTNNIIVQTYGIIALTNSIKVLTNSIIVLTNSGIMFSQGNTRLRWLVPLLLSLALLSTFVALRLSDAWGNTYPVGLQVP